MLDELGHSSVAFWLLVLLIATIDSLVILKPGEFTYRILRGRRIKLRASPHPYLMQGREPIITLVTYPLTPVFLSSINAPDHPRSELSKALFANKRVANDCIPLSTLAMTTLVLFIFCGPLLSMSSSTGEAIILVWSASYIIALITVAYVWLCRHQFGLYRKHILKIALEFMFCPFLVVNIVKKITVQQIALLNTRDLIEMFAQNREVALENMYSNLEEHSIIPRSP